MRVKESLRRTVLSVTVIILAILLFYRNLFYPTLGLIVTPDFGRSDSLDLSIATKYSLWTHLQNNELPFWEEHSGNGLPILSEGHPGAFFLPNLLLFRFLSFTNAYNMSLVLAVVLFSVGTYFYLSALGVSELGRLFGAITAGFSGTVIPHLTHITLLQGFTLLPLELYFLHAYIKSHRAVPLVLFIFTASQQIFSGFAQSFFISYQLLTVYYFWYEFKRGSRLSSVIVYALTTAAVFILSSAQILPMLEFSRFSSASGGFDLSNATYFSYPLKHLVTLINPFALGNPSKGTYPDFTSFDGSIFWENTSYIGIIPLILIAVSLLIPGVRKKFLARPTIFYILTVPVTLLLMTGKHSPFYFIFSIWPFSLFRVPSRYIWVFSYSLLVCSVLAFDALRNTLRRKFRYVIFLSIILIALQYLCIYRTWQGYHLIGPSSSWLSRPESASELTGNARITSIFYAKKYNDIFLKHGWSGRGEDYYNLRDLLTPNSNILWNITSINSYGGRLLKRAALVDSYVQQSFTDDGAMASSSAEAEKMLTLYGITHVVSGMPVRWLNGTVTGGRTGSSYTYAYPEGKRIVYLASRIFRLSDYPSIDEIFSDRNFSTADSAIVEKSGTVPCAGADSGTAALLGQKGFSRLFTVSVPCDALVVINQAYYPFVNVTVDGKVHAFEPVNINQIGVRVPEGTHVIATSIEPKSVRYGAIISAAGYCLLLAAVALGSGFFHRRKAS